MKSRIVFELHAGSLANAMGIEIGGLVEAGRGEEREREQIPLSRKHAC